MGRRMGLLGVLLLVVGAGSNLRISGSGATSSEHWPAVAYNSIRNEYLVVWSDGRHQATRGYDIYGRRVAG